MIMAAHGIRVMESQAGVEISSVTLTGAEIVIEQDGKRWIVEVTSAGEVTRVTEVE
jgi:predicted RecB family endonuclease